MRFPRRENEGINLVNLALQARDACKLDGRPLARAVLLQLRDAPLKHELLLLRAQPGPQGRYQSSQLWLMLCPEHAPAFFASAAAVAAFVHLL